MKGITTTPEVLKELLDYKATRSAGARPRNTSLGTHMPHLLESCVSSADRARAAHLGCQSKGVVLFDKGCGHPPFPMRVASFVRIDLERTGHCPECMRALTREKSLALLKPALLEEWDWEQNAGIDPWQIAARSSRVVSWSHSSGCGESWFAAISNRTKKDRPTGCPRCSVRASRLQLHCAAELGALGAAPEAEKYYQGKDGPRADLFLSKGFSQEIYVEVDGYPHHDGPDAAARDSRKDEIAAEQGRLMIRLRSSPLVARSALDIEHDPREDFLRTIKRLVGQLIPLVERKDLKEAMLSYLGQDELLAEDEALDKINARYTVSDGNPSLEERNSKAGADYDRCADANGGFAAQIPATSPRVAEFLCNCGHAYRKPVREAVRCKEPCPACNKQVVPDADHLSATHPEFWEAIQRATAAGYNGGRDLTRLRSGSSLRVNWVCKCGEMHHGTEVRERAQRGKGKCWCEMKKSGACEARNLSHAPASLRDLYCGEDPIHEVALNTHRKVFWRCGGADGRHSPGCAGTVSRIVRNAVSSFFGKGGKRSGVLPTCSYCRALKLPQNKQRPAKR